MEEDQRRKQKTTQKQVKYDMQYEGRDYFPFGRQGGGAPLRDENGNIQTMRAGYFTDHNQG